MNSPLPPRSGRLLAGILGCLCAIGNVSASEVTTPRGTLNVDRDLVRTGTRSQLAWQIEYPAPVTSVVDILPPNIIKPKKDLKMRVRILGAALRDAKANNGHGNNVDGVDSSNPGQASDGPTGAVDPSSGFDDERRAIRHLFPVELLWSKNSPAWISIFSGYQTEVDPTKVVLETTVKTSDTINFGGRCWRGGSWLPLYDTVRPTSNLVMLKNGDKVPTTVPALNGSLIERFLKPYMNTSTKTVQIGDRDLILLMELDQTKTSASGFDLQDLVVLVTFE